MIARSVMRVLKSRKDKLIEHKQYIDKHGEDLPEVRQWKWGTTPTKPA